MLAKRFLCQSLKLSTAHFVKNIFETIHPQIEKIIFLPFGLQITVLRDLPHFIFNYCKGYIVKANSHKLNHFFICKYKISRLKLRGYYLSNNNLDFHSIQ